MTPKQFKMLLNLYPPYLGAGVKITYIAADWQELHVTLVRRWYNRNAVGTHFGGSLYSMVDPHLMLLMMQCLGDAYWVWDKSAEIEFVKATKKTVKAIIQISEVDLSQVREQTASGEKYLPEFWIEIKDPEGELIARVKKVIYVRLKK